MIVKMTIAVVSSPDSFTHPDWWCSHEGDKKENNGGVKMEPRIEDYLDSTCVASTGGDITKFMEL